MALPEKTENRSAKIAVRGPDHFRRLQRAAGVDSEHNEILNIGCHLP
jgi:hypothetical protein